MERLKGVWGRKRDKEGVERRDKTHIEIEAGKQKSRHALSPLKKSPKTTGDMHRHSLARPPK
jgi:hypothetical protein